MWPNTIMEDHPSDSDQIPEDQIQYTVLDGDIVPLDAFGFEVGVDQRFGIDVDAYEGVLEQTTELNNLNWELKYKCQEYEQELRILKRSVPQKIKDRLHHWKRVATNLTRKTKKWVKRLSGKPTDEVFRRAPPRYRDLLAERYYPTNFNQE